MLLLLLGSEKKVIAPVSKGPTRWKQTKVTSCCCCNGDWRSFFC